MKRFWHAATAELRDGVWRILLDGKQVRLPDGSSLQIHNETLATAIAAEWQAIGGGKIDSDMSWAEVPLTQLAGTAQHRIALNPDLTITVLARFAESDCLCYRAEHPPALEIRQHEAWQPWLDWAAANLNARLIVTNGIIAVRQPEDALEAVTHAVAQLNVWQLTGLGVLVPCYGSVVLGLAVAAGALSANDAYRLSIIDETFQQEMWGTDNEAAIRQARIARDVANAERFMELSSQ